MTPYRNFFAILLSVCLVNTSLAQDFEKWKVSDGDFIKATATFKIFKGFDGIALTDPAFKTTKGKKDTVNQPRYFEKTLPFYSGAPFQKFGDDLIWCNFLGDHANVGTVHIPQAISMYTPQADWSVMNTGGDWWYPQINQLTREATTAMGTPFYFRKFEVTNLEYRTFLVWVRSNDPAKEYNYTFHNKKSEAIARGSIETIDVYPDTAVWTKDFIYSFNKPMDEHYFSHPAYDDYPVVGINWFQAMAYLDWLTMQHQKALDATDANLTIEYTLPNDMEWAIASLTGTSKGKRVYHQTELGRLHHINWLSDLKLSNSGEGQATNKLDFIVEGPRRKWIADGNFFTGKANLDALNGKARKLFYNYDFSLDEMGISWMGGNLSEWMLNSYSEYQPGFLTFIQSLGKSNNEADGMASAIYMHYDNKNNRDGMLVRGANWYDERYANKHARKNTAGMGVKTFIDPAEQHCTVGFRYVIHVYPKQMADKTK